MTTDSVIAPFSFGIGTPGLAVSKSIITPKGLLIEFSEPFGVGPMVLRAARDTCDDEQQYRVYVQSDDRYERVGKSANTLDAALSSVVNVDA